MDFALTEEQVELQSTVAAFLAKRLPEADVRRTMETPSGYDDATWNEFADQMQLTGLAIPEQYGGLGFGLVELGVVAQEMGRALSGLPYFSSVVLAANALLASGDEAAKTSYLPGIASGALRAALALPETSPGWDTDSLAVTASQNESAWTLDGRAHAVIDGSTAELILVAATVGDDVGLFAVDADAAGFERRPEASIDLTRRLATLTFTGTPATPVGAPTDGRRILDDTRAIGSVILAAEQVGTAEKCLDLAVEYAKTREQFGVLIGTFQAVAHRCADILGEVLTARYAALSALSAADNRGTGDEWRIEASLARIRCTEAVNYAAAECIQVHGGNGYTWEFPIHLFFRRARGSELTLGVPALHRELMGDLLGL